MKSSEKTPYPRRSAKKKETRKRIIRAANRHIHDYGPSAITMNDIADAADIHVTTMFTHFASKTELFDSLSEIMIDKISNDIESYMETVGFFDYMRVRVQALFGEYTDKREEVFDQPLHLRNYPELASAWMKYQNHVIDLWTKYIARDLGMSSEESKIPELIACMLITANMRAYDRWMADKETVNLIKETLANINIAESFAPKQFSGPNMG